MHIHKGDNVLVIAGKDRGRIGTVTRAFVRQGRVIVDGMNIRKRHVRAKKAGQKGEVVQVFAPLDASNIKVICGTCKKATRVGYRVLEHKKTRICKKCGGAL